ncbi:hypothetical protein Dsin_008378 [Dipteronia sinensis]|uniref:RNase H type-1 domain-containing protein n=1 Tax=Dipteronia sinensis TaxID=43782 RepID=A0AAE0ANK7_9ROSI|nr:hypothetical protein Dsin_008378 [Dipteronia sinensis]
MYKIKCDAAIDLAGCLVGCGTVIRNAEGFVLAASSQIMVASFPTHTVEAIAILRSIQLAIDSGLNLIMVESDASVVVDWINSGNDLLSDVGVIISDIKKPVTIYTLCCGVLYSQIGEQGGSLLS